MASFYSSPIMSCHVLWLRLSELALLILFSLVAVIMEYLCLIAVDLFSFTFRVLLETVTHGVVGVIFWLFCNLRLSMEPHWGLWWYILESCFWVFVFAILPDVDHFICAQSFDLQSARSLPGRPFLHWIGVHVIFLGLLLFVSLCSSSSSGWFVSHVLSFAWLILIAFVSHVMRDARHRGLWVWPPPDRHTWTAHTSNQGNGHLQIWQTSPLPLFPVYLLSILTISVPFHYRFAEEVLEPSVSSEYVHYLPRLRFLPAQLSQHRASDRVTRTLRFAVLLWASASLNTFTLSVQEDVCLPSDIYVLGTGTNAPGRTLKRLLQRWLMRQRCDPYVRRARIESYRCRSAFKLLQLHELIPQGLFHSGDIVVDCGAAPGSWSQVAVSHVCPLKSQSSTVSSRLLKPGLVIALDLLDFAPIPGVVRHQRTDLRDSANCAGLVRQSIAEHSDNPTAKVNIVLSDMAPNASGLRNLDIPSMMILAHSVLQLAIRVSAPGACLVVKLWECREAESFKKLVSRFYAGPWNSKSTTEKEGSPSCVQFIKPAASRKDSSEIYLVARGFCLPTLTIG
ncbi:hypothetical protein P879_03038 [Paragonimus westermani]|uniref:rRNA methyltransferase 2, mitochondrial n=1 Tax=Paragonimus westermani TaxID=34504 RepID=A0A8T0DS38_9TREM|nr:hypothetical protein P879_03038 [Paragonimus westermani]